MDEGSTTIKNKLNMLSELKSQQDDLALQKQALIDRVITPQLKAEIAEIESEFTEPAVKLPPGLPKWNPRLSGWRRYTGNR